MKLFFPALLILFIACNNSDKSKNTIINRDTIGYINFNKINELDINAEKSNRIYGADTVALKYINVEYKDVHHKGKCKLKRPLPRHTMPKYYVINSIEEANEIFEKCDLIKNIDFNKYTLIGIARSSNGTERISKEVLSIPESKTILVKININYLSGDQNIAYHFQTWVLISKPKDNWKIQVLTNG
jgi:hypothetical protein